jgi:hypothetical protein
MVFFILFGKQYRTDFSATKVEMLEDGGKWTATRNPRVVSRAKAAVQEWLEKAKGGQ